MALAGLQAGAARGDRDVEDRLPSGALRDGAHHYQIVIARGWRPLTAPEGTLVAYQSAGGRSHLAITRIDVGRRGARDAAALVAEVERGVERATPGFRRLRRKLSEGERTATFDLWYERDGSQVLSRYLIFSRHTVVLSIGVDGRDDRRAAEAMLKSFTPFQ
ncbi:MAG TPA: hypothetical protein VNO33_14870 [Kofleriaceae bacterium]|nr:hypothetical protein [Kofleriaceae bacterium]